MPNGMRCLDPSIADRITSLSTMRNNEEIFETFGFSYNTLRKVRSEEHTSELQSLMRISYAVFCLKKKRKKNNTKRRQDKQQVGRQSKNHRNTLQADEELKVLEESIQYICKKKEWKQVIHEQETNKQNSINKSTNLILINYY